MATYTASDLKAAAQYASERGKLAKLQMIDSKHPNIARKVRYTIQDADKNIDYYYRDDFQDRAIRVTMRIDETLCDFIKCVPWFTDGPCKPGDEARYYRLGDSDKFELACGPMCYNLDDQVTFDDDGEAQVQFPTVVYNKYSKKCLFDSLAKNWMDTPLSRSDARYETRLNNFEIGFTREETPETMTGYRYNYNQYYCENFAANYNRSTRNCELPWYNSVLDAVIGMSFINTATAAIRQAVTGSSLIPSGVADPPPIDSRWKVMNWRTNVKAEAIIPDPDTNERQTNEEDLTFRATHRNFPSMVHLFRKGKDISAFMRDNVEHYTVIENNKDVGEHYNVKKSNRANSDDSNEDDDNNEDEVEEKPPSDGSFISFISDAIDSIINSSSAEVGDFIKDLLVAILTSPETYMGIAADILLETLPKLFKRIGSKLSSLILQQAARLVGTIGANVFRSSLFVVISRSAVSIVGKVLSKAVVALAKLAGMASTVVGILLAVVAVLDLILMFWDPLGFNNQFPDGYLDDMQRQLDQALRSETGLSVPEMNFDLLCMYLLTENELLESSINELVYIFEYLDHLTVNSEGSRIIKGDELSGDLTPQPNDRDELAAHQLKIYTQRELAQYEKAHTSRLKILQGINFIALIVGSIGVASCVVLSSHLIGVVVLMFSITLFIISYFASSSTFIFEIPYIEVLYDKIDQYQWLDRLF